MPDPNDPSTSPPPDPDAPQDGRPAASQDAWNRPAPPMPEVLRNAPPPRADTEQRPRRRLSLVPSTSGSDMRAIGLGLDFAAMVGAAVLLGWGADKLLSMSRGIMIGLVVGLAVASWHFYKGARRLNREFDSAGRSRPPRQPPPNA